MTTRIISILVLLFLALPCAAQQFDFDYVQEYHLETYGEKARNVTFFKFFNSKDAGYSLGVRIVGERVFMSLNLANGDCYSDSILKEDFFVYGISLKCPRKGKSENYPDIDPDAFNYAVITDTVIDAKRCGRIQLKPKGKKFKGKFPASVFIIDNSYNFNLSVADPTGVLSRYKQMGKDVPAGIIKEYYAQDKDGKFTDRLTLIQCVTTQKIIFLDTSCK